MSNKGLASHMTRFPLRGGNWNNLGNCGLAALNLNNSRANANSNIGFRPASDHFRGPEAAQPRLCRQRPIERMPDPRLTAKNHHASRARYLRGSLRDQNTIEEE